MRLEITVKVKTNMKFAKIFEAAEVCCLSAGAMNTFD